MVMTRKLTALLVTAFCIVAFFPSLLSAEITSFPDIEDSSHVSPIVYSEVPPDTSSQQAPTVALFKSMLVPGLGQISNRSYIKAGLVIGLESVLIGAIVHWTEKTNDARDRLDAETDSALRPGLYSTFSDYKSRRNLYSWFLGTTIFLSMFDAYVDAHLSRFPKNPETKKGLSFDIGPSGVDEVSVELTYNF